MGMWAGRASRMGFLGDGNSKVIPVDGAVVSVAEGAFTARLMAGLSLDGNF